MNLEQSRALALEWAPLWLPVAAIVVDWANYRAQKEADPKKQYSYWKAGAWLVGAFAVALGVQVPGVA
jgi:hypothetical protein